MTAIIDTHAHVYPDRYLDVLEQGGISPKATKIARGLHAGDSDAELDRRIAMMERAGVQAQVLSATPQVPQLEDAGAAVAAARMVNDLYRDVVDRRPGRFISLGALPLPHVDESLTELTRCLDELGMPGVAVNAFVGAEGSLTEEAYEPLWAELDRRGAILYIHPSGLSAGCAPIADHGLTWVNGAPMEDAIATLQLLKADIPYRYPNVRIQVAHLGGDLPFLAQRLQDNYEDWGSFAHSPLDSLRRLWFDAANFHTPSLHLALEVYDPCRVMMGSDFPYFQDEKYTRAVQYIRDLAGRGQSAESIDKVLSGNAQALYGPLAGPRSAS